MAVIEDLDKFNSITRVMCLLVKQIIISLLYLSDPKMPNVCSTVSCNYGNVK